MRTLNQVKETKLSESSRLSFLRAPKQNKQKNETAARVLNWHRLECTFSVRLMLLSHEGHFLMRNDFVQEKF